MIAYPPEDFPVDVELVTALSPLGKTVAVLTVTNGSERRPATLGPIGLAHLDAALDRARDIESLDAIVITGNGRTFCAGANLDALSSPPSETAAHALAEEGHRVFGRLSAMGVPTVAAINGTALGGGFELALHCTHRVATSNAAPLGLPEIGLGLIPGWGGATLLPALIGIDAALRIMVDNAISGTTLNTRAARELGIVDQLVEEVITGALNFVDSIESDKPSSERLASASNEDEINSAIDRFVRRPGNPVEALEKLRDVLNGVAQSSVAESFSREDDALSSLMMTAEFRRRLYAFRVTSAASKAPAGTPDATPREIRRVGVVGAGLMASQIALIFSERLAVEVVISDVALDRLEAAIARIDGWVLARVAKGGITPDQHAAIMSRFRPTLEMTDFAECDLVIEAVFEDLEVKKTVLTALEDVVRADAILASNTSSLSIAAMAEFVESGDRVAGIHFFNPVAAMKLVEVVRAPHESDETLVTAVDVARRLGKTPVLVADRPGFVVNRLLSTFLGESLRAVESGVPVEAVAKALEPLRLPMTPFALIDLIGRRVSLAMMQSLERSAPERFFVGEALPALVDHDSNSILADDLRERYEPRHSVAEKEIHDRIVDSLAREVRIMLDENVVMSASDIDVCMINGAGWSAAIGGLTPYLDGSGSSERAAGGLFHPSANFR